MYLVVNQSFISRQHYVIVYETNSCPFIHCILLSTKIQKQAAKINPYYCLNTLVFENLVSVSLIHLYYKCKPKKAKANKISEEKYILRNLRRKTCKTPTWMSWCMGKPRIICCPHNRKTLLVNWSLEQWNRFDTSFSNWSLLCHLAFCLRHMVK